MSVHTEATLEQENWFMQTSVTVGLQAPLRSFNKDRLVSAAFFLGRALSKNSDHGYAWIDFCRWTPDQKYGMQQHVDESYQLAFTRHGVAVMKNWEDLFIPSSEPQPGRPVLIYDYDSFCFLFCDAAHFIRETQAWTVFAEIFGVSAPPIAETPPEGRFAQLREYMALHDLGTDGEGQPLRPDFHN